MSASEIQETVARLDREERLQMLEALSEAMQKDEPDSPAWHGDILAERLAKVESGNATFFTLEELKKRFGR
ncbi:MAG TPA: addiction module protein [Chthoniobacteraceae bacterium]|nr:addiction module protein [Chthoniobacteraceae bacterium]